MKSLSLLCLFLSAICSFQNVLQSCLFSSLMRFCIMSSSWFIRLTSSMNFLSLSLSAFSKRSLLSLFSFIWDSRVRSISLRIYLPRALASSGSVRAAAKPSWGLLSFLRSYSSLILYFKIRSQHTYLFVYLFKKHCPMRAHGLKSP